MAKNKKKRLCDEWADGYIDYPEIGIITDKQVADMVMKHTTLFDRLFRPEKLVRAGLLAQNMLMKVVETPEEKDWRF